MGFFSYFEQLYELDNDPQRKEFLDDLFVFMQKRGMVSFIYLFILRGSMGALILSSAVFVEHQIKTQVLSRHLWFKMLIKNKWHFQQQTKAAAQFKGLNGFKWAQTVFALKN